MELIVPINSRFPLVLDGSIEMPDNASGCLLWKLCTETVRAFHNFEQIDFSTVPFLGVVKDVFSYVGGGKHVTVSESHGEREVALGIVESVFFGHRVNEGAWVLEGFLHYDFTITTVEKLLHVKLFEDLLEFFAVTTIFPRRLEGSTHDESTDHSLHKWSLVVDHLKWMNILISFNDLSINFLLVTQSPCFSL